MRDGASRTGAMIGVVCVVASFASAAPQPRDVAKQILATTLAGVVSGKPQSLLQLLHEPRSYDAAQAAEDRRKFGSHLGLLFREFGRASSVREGVPAEFFRLELAG